MENLPLYISIFFGATTFLTVYLFYKAAHHSKLFLTVVTAWLAIQGLIAYTGFYTIANTIPPRFVLLVLPPLAAIILLFITKKGKYFLDRLDVKPLTLLHTIRIPVEMVLFWLFLQKTVPQIMTFEGRNFDIISGITAPVVYYFGFIRKTLNKKLILIWNFICLALLINIVATAVLSAPFPFQKLAFDQPAVAILHFPFIWLPCCIVPIVLLSHLASVRQLLKAGRKTSEFILTSKAA